MAITEDFFNSLLQDPGIAKNIGLDANNVEQRFNLVMVLKQIEMAATGWKEKPLAETRQMGFDSIQEIGGRGRDAIMDIVRSHQYQKVGLDSNGLYGATELTYFDPRFFEFEHKPLMFRTLFPVTHLSGPADKQYSYKMERLIGKAEYAGESANTHYVVDVDEEDTFLNIKKIDVKFTVTTDDLRAAVKTGRPIEVRKMKAGARSAEEQMNDTIILGNTKSKMLGFVNNPDLILDEVADGGGGGDPKLWINKTSKEILVGDIGAAIAIMRSLTFNLHSPKYMGVSIEKYNFLAQTWIETALSPIAITLLSYLKSSLEGYGLEEIVPMSELSGAGPGGEELAIFWSKDENVLQVDVAMELIWLAPQFHGTNIVFHGEAKIVDFILRRKQGIRGIYGF